MTNWQQTDKSVWEMYSVKIKCAFAILSKSNSDGEILPKSCRITPCANITVYKNNVHNSGIILNSRFSNRQKKHTKMLWFKWWKIGFSNGSNPQKNYVPVSKIISLWTEDSYINSNNQLKQPAPRKKLLKLCPYKITGTQQLSPPEWGTREQYCRCYHELVTNGSFGLECMIFLGKARFTINGNM